MAERDGATASAVEQRLRVRPVRRAGRRVARVADRDVAVQAAQLLLVEDLRDEAHVAQHGQPAVVGDGDPGRLLAAVLERDAGRSSVSARDVALRARGCRRRRTSADRPELAQLQASRSCRLGRARDDDGSPYGASASDRRSSAAARTSAASASACARPPSRDVVRERAGAAPPARGSATSSASAPRSSSARAREHDVALAPAAPAPARTSGTSPTQPTTGVGGIARPSVSL